MGYKYVVKYLEDERYKEEYADFQEFEHEKLIEDDDDVIAEAKSRFNHAKYPNLRIITVSIYKIQPIRIVGVTGHGKAVSSPF